VRGGRVRMELRLTLSRIRHATCVLSERLGSGERFLMWIPISYDVLSSPIGRMEIASVCRNLSSELRPYLIFEISELPYGVPQSRLSELVGSLRPFCRCVMAQLTARVANYGAYLGAGLHAIGLSLPAPGVSEIEIDSEISKLSVAAKKQQIMSFVLDVPNAALLLSARECGINLLSSPFIGEARNAPTPIKRLPAQDIVMAATGAFAIAT